MPLVNMRRSGADRVFDFDRGGFEGRRGGVTGDLGRVYCNVWCAQGVIVFLLFIGGFLAVTSVLMYYMIKLIMCVAASSAASGQTVLHPACCCSVQRETCVFDAVTLHA